MRLKSKNTQSQSQSQSEGERGVSKIIIVHPKLVGVKEKRAPQNDKKIVRTIKFFVFGP